MINNRKVIAIMMLRDGSSRIPDKNMKLMNGVSLCKITLDKMRASKYVDSIYISTSSERYKKMVSQWGFGIIDRPEALSGDSVILLDVMKHAVKSLDVDDETFVLQVEPTKPLGKSEHFDQVIEEAERLNLDSCFTIKELKANLLGNAAVVSQAKPEAEKRYLYFGYVRLRKAKVFEACSGWGCGPNHIDLPIIADYEIDIDYPWQWIAAEALIKAGY